MLYTSYFGNMRNLPKTCIPIAICAKPPSWFTGLCCKDLAPSYHCLMVMWRSTLSVICKKHLGT